MHQFVLGVVGVLVLVNVDVVELILVVGQSFRRLFEELDRLHDQVVKIQGLVAFQFLLVGFVNARHDPVKGALMVLGKGGRILHRILGV